MKKWEYKVIEYDGEIDFESLGDEGWELVSVTPPHGLRYRIYYFKREKDGKDIIG